VTPGQAGVKAEILNSALIMRHSSKVLPNRVEKFGIRRKEAATTSLITPEDPATKVVA
jgi:hypothetical protein